MAVSQSVSATQTSVTWRLYGFSALDVNTRRFRFEIGGMTSGTTVYYVDRVAGTTDATCTFTGLYPGQSYELTCSMTTFNPNTGMSSGTTYTYSDSVSTPPESYSLNFIASAGATSIWLYAYGISPSVYDRELILFVDGNFVNNMIISANSSPSSLSGYYYNVTEGSNYTASVELVDYSGKPLYSESKIVTTAYDTSMSLRVNSITDTSMTVNAYGLGANKNYSRSLKWYKKGPDDTDLIQASTTQISANSGDTSFTMPLSNLKANSAYSFKVELIGPPGTMNTLTVSANTLEAPGTLTVDNIGESAVTLILSGMTSAIGRKIKWYYKKSTDTVYTAAGSTDMTSSASSVSKVINSLVNETAYNFKAEIYDADDTDYVIGIKTATAMTQRQVAIMSLGSATSVSLRVNLTEMETNVNYDKYIYWYIKRSTDANFDHAGTDIVSADSGASSISRLFTGLVSSTLNQDGSLNRSEYDVRVVIKKNDVTTMTTITNTYSTTLRDSDIPQPTITEVLQIIGEKKAELWWEAPEHVASSEVYVHYDIEVSTDGASFSTVKTVDVPPADYTELSFSAYGTEYYMRVKAYPVGTSVEYKYSNVVKVTLTENFDWETVQSGKPCIVRADKWNLLIRYIRKRLADKGINATYEMSRARSGNKITAHAFNQLVTACNAFYATGITEKQTGDAIRAEDLLKLQEAVNDKGGTL